MSSFYNCKSYSQDNKECDSTESCAKGLFICCYECDLIGGCFDRCDKFDQEYAVVFQRTVLVKVPEGTNREKIKELAVKVYNDADLDDMYATEQDVVAIHASLSYKGE